MIFKNWFHSANVSVKYVQTTTDFICEFEDIKWNTFYCYKPTQDKIIFVYDYRMHVLFFICFYDYTMSFTLKNQERWKNKLYVYTLNILNYKPIKLFTIRNS